VFLFRNSSLREADEIRRGKYSEPKLKETVLFLREYFTRSNLLDYLKG
jgi:hypothetical protein